ncbi:enkurin domain-containing protein 1 isoform X1 [Polypterus senegalus]|uniref:enkurin domain-containing protein 1 isoform X1 n=1 Tax=Polypterus senegalus TaxID=55291 RepID=UPI00196255FC|nr:enkurin domain-containing protein 1 isoform X1 [Polypterus senegalus]XP_039624110.1 enkurin domain-containing protein 1 isoform X1 [Polypterus senegalus]
MSEGLSKICGPIPPDPTLFPDCYKRPMSARGRLEGNDLKLDFLSGPLAPDPTLYPTCYSARPAPVPRVRPNATDILERSKKGSVGNLLQLEGVALHIDTHSRKKDAKNHEKENVRRMREIQRRCREKEMEKEETGPKPVKALWKSQKYEAVQSKVMAQLQQNQAVSVPINEETSPPKKPDCQNFLRAYSRCGAGGRPKSSQSCSLQKSQSSATLKEDINTSGIQVRGSLVDFVSHNARNAKSATLRRSKSLQLLSDVVEKKKVEQEEYNTKQKGRIPQYLQERKDQWQREREERKKNQPDPSMPPGHSMMPEKERQETLHSLKETQKNLVKELLSLPVRADTLSIQARRTQLDKKLSEVEEAIKIFSRPKVFIKIDN